MASVESSGSNSKQLSQVDEKKPRKFFFLPRQLKEGKKPVRDPITVSIDQIYKELSAFLLLEYDIEAEQASLSSDLVDELDLDQLALVEIWEFLADQFQLEYVPQGAIWMPNTIQDLCEAAQAVIGDPTSYVPADPPAQITACLFPGQGAQSLGMAAQLVKDFAPARKLFEKAEKMLGFDLLKICTEGPVEKLNQTDISQPAILVASLAKLEQLRAQKPELVKESNLCAGLSLGEYSALVFSGAISFEDALRVVQVRGQAMQLASEQCDSGMTSVLGLDLKTVGQLVAQVQAELPDKVLVIANDLCPGNIAISGHTECLARAEKLAMSEEYAAKKVTRLKVAGAFHSALMAPAVPQLEEALKGIKINTPKIPIVLNTTGKVCSNPDEIRQQLVLQVTAPVQWRKSMEVVIAEHDKVLEIGPGEVLKGLLRHVSRALKKTVNVSSHKA